ncbi:MAG: 2-oxoacid:acceptor oxidoreductase subunit alpha, partial [Candidatus Bathyarchaeia archaeon]
VQEMFDLTIKAFNTAEKYRQPVLVMADQIIGHMTGPLRIPEENEIHAENRRLPPRGEGAKIVPFHFDDDFPAMAQAGMGYRVNIDSLTHDEKGYPSTKHDVSTRMIEHIVGKIRKHAKEIMEIEEIETEDAQVVVVAYGCTSRSALRAVRDARSTGVKAGLLRLITAWPFPGEVVWGLSERVKAMVVPEINFGQMVHVVREYAHCPVHSVPLAPGAMPSPEMILSTIKEVVS